MRLSYIVNALGLILMDIGLVTFIPIFVALYYQEFGSILPFFAAGIFALFIGAIFKRCVKNVTVESLNDIKKSEALAIVSTSWLMFGVIAAIPYLYYGLAPIDALFEAVSGITTTGATILQRFDYPRAIIFWRSFTQWLGGMGIIVLFVAILPSLRLLDVRCFLQRLRDRLRISLLQE